MVLAERLAAALTKLERGAWLEAEILAQAALVLDADNPQASLLLGLAIAAMGEVDRAAGALNRAARLRPSASHPCQDLVALKPALPPTLIRRQFRACVRLSPRDAPLHLAFAEFLLDQDWAPEAELVLAKAALAGVPASAASCHLTGLAQAEQGRFATAIVSFERAVALDPHAAASWSNLGIVLKTEGRFEAAIEAHDQAVELDPGNARYRVNRAVTLLKAGHWESAWQDYEWRLKMTTAPAVNLDRLLPSLSALGDLKGLTIAAMHEEGFGDTLQFLRYLPLLAERGAKVVVCVPQALVRLMATVPGVAAVVTDAVRLPEYNFVCPFFSLPRVFGTTIETIPPSPQLAPDPALVRQWTLRLPRDGMLVGLVWAGQSRPWLPGFRTLDRRRSAGLEAFAPLSALPNVQLVSLQVGQSARQTVPPGMTVFNPMARVTDFADTAAIIAALDVVVSVDTSVVHLAGLCGKPVFLLDRYDGCWRWLSDQRTSPWYPKLTIFRQEEPGDWSAPMTRLVASLDALALFHGIGGRAAVTCGVREPGPAVVA